GRRYPTRVGARGALWSERRTEAHSVELLVQPPRVEHTAVGVVDNLAGIAHDDASRPLDVDREPNIAAAVRVEEAGPRVALGDRLPVCGDCGVVIVVDPHLDRVAVLIDEHIKEAVLVFNRDEDVKPPRRRSTNFG